MLQNAVTFRDDIVKPPLVDDWKPEVNDPRYFFSTKNFIICPGISKMWGYNTATELDYFNISPKRAYNTSKDDLYGTSRDQFVHYLNYFETFYDKEHELVSLYAQLKYLIDYQPNYNATSFLNDIKRYILGPSIIYKVDCMNRDNYLLALSYSNKKNPCLQYNNKHGMILMKISLIIKMIIPLACHFMKQRNITTVNDFLLSIFDNLLDAFDADIYSKLYETSMSNVSKSLKNHSVLWQMQDIRSKNQTTLSLSAIDNIILQLMPKYVYKKNVVCLNFESIDKVTGFQVENIKYEYEFKALSASKRDADNMSDIDKYEAFQAKSDESKLVQNKVNYKASMKLIHQLFGPFTDEEINYYLEKVPTILDFQKDLIFNLMFKFFGEPVSIKNINKRDWAVLLIASKRYLLQKHNMKLFPYMLCGKFDRLNMRKNVNKKEFLKLTIDPYFQQIVDNYKNPKIEEYIMSIIATYLASEIRIVDYFNDDIDDYKIQAISDIVCAEILMTINLIIG